MWIALAFASAFFAGLTSILAKVGLRNIDSNLATAVRTIVVVIFAWLMVALTGSFTLQISTRSLVFLTFSGIATGASWLFYFKALKIGDINKVVPVDKSSTIMTMLLAFILLGEEFTFYKLLCMLLIALGTFLMILKVPKIGANRCERIKGSQTEKTGSAELIMQAVTKYSWLCYAFLAAFFAALTSILGKIGITDIDATLGTAIRTVVVLLMAWIIVFIQKGQHEISKIDKKSGLFLILSGIATGACWLCFYTALQSGPASVVVPIDKLSIVMTIVFGIIVFKERLRLKSFAGLGLIVVGTIWLIFL